MMNLRTSSLFLAAAAVSMIGILRAPAASASNCVPSASGTEVIASNCAFFGSLAGVDDGGITVNGGATLTVNAGQTIVWSIGNTLSISGAVALNATGKLQQSYLWMLDADADGWPANTTQVVQDTSPGSGYARRSTMRSLGTTDCNDGAYSAANICGRGDGGKATGVVAMIDRYLQRIRSTIIPRVRAFGTPEALPQGRGGR